MATEQVAVIYSPEFLDHDTGTFHPENPGRLQAIVAALKAVSWADHLDWRQPTPTSQRDVLPLILQHHDPRYVETLRAIAAQGGGQIDGDTPVSRRSYDVALLAVSAWLDGIDYVLKTGQSAFVVARPPGHHAVPERGMGFCLFSNAALAAYYALEQPGIDRVAILDWDVHHGNGTQAMVEDTPKIAYCSLHQAPFYPGTGRSEEQGHYQNILNLPMAAGSTSADYATQFKQTVIPFLQGFAPQLLIVSAGYDGHRSDPLASMMLQAQDYGTFTRACLEVTPKILFGLEGGYDHTALGQSVVATLAARLDVDA
ncbi:histone deacetylase [filamentous cyanobacterium CCP5]|nr:histone deacetylase [filamentous cyanobacterium CCP5]